MSTTVHTGWLKDSNGEKFAPKTLASQIQTSDGTLLEDKLQADLEIIKNEMQNVYVTPQMYGAKGDGTTDDTDAINAAIESAGNNGIVFFPEGTYLLSSSMDSSLDESKRYMAVKIYKKENLTLLLSPKAHLKHRPVTEEECIAGNEARYYVIGISKSSNIKVIGGHIEGEADEHTYHWYQDDGTYSRAQGHGISIRSSSDIVIDGCDIFNCYGDSIVISRQGSGVKSKNVRIKNCILHNSMRQGISVVGADNTFITGCEIYNIGGCTPQSGIDFEPNYIKDSNLNSVVENCYIHDCEGYTVVNALANRGTIIRDCILHGKVTCFNDDTYPVEYINCDIMLYQSSNAHRNIVRNCRIASCGIYEMGDDFYDCTFDPELFDHISDGYGATIRNIIEIGENILSNASICFYRCKFNTANSNGYNSEFKLWRNLGNVGEANFDGCQFILGQHSYQGIRIQVLKNLSVSNCLFVTSEVSYNKQFLEMYVPEKLTFLNNSIDIKSLTSYNDMSIILINGKNVYVEENRIIASSKISNNAITQSFIGDAGEIYYLRNVMPLWDKVGNLPTNTATKSVLAGNIISTSQTESSFTKNDRILLDEILNEGFMTTSETTGYVDTKIANLNSQGIQQTPLFANNIEECTDTSKVYVLPNGYIYAYMYVESTEAKFTNLADTTSNDWLTGYRLNYQATPVAANNTDISLGSFVSNFFPCKQYDVIRIKGVTGSTGGTGTSTYFTFSGCDADGNNVSNKSPVLFINPPSSIFVSDSSWTRVENQVNVTEDGVYEYTILLNQNGEQAKSYAPNIVKGRIAGIPTNGIENVIITINEEIVYETSGYRWMNTGHAFVPADYESRILALEAKIAELESSVS